VRASYDSNHFAPAFGRGQLKCDGTRAETRFRLSAKRTSPFKSAGASFHSTGSRGVRISGSNAGYTMFRGSVKSTGYPLYLPVFPSLPPVRRRLPSHFNWSLPVCRLAQRSGFKSPVLILVGLRGGTALSTVIFAGFLNPLKRLSPVTQSLTANQCSDPSHLDTTCLWLVNCH
jgi:hypothetical protein